MAKLNRTHKFMKELMQEHWTNGELIGLDSIIYSNGTFLKIEIESVRNEALKNTFGREYFLRFVGESFLEEVLNTYENDDLWSEYQANNKVNIDDEYFIICGEGGMGNEGFIARTDLNNNLEWVLFSTTSNPFSQIKILGNNIYVQSSHNFWVMIDKINNKNISIINEL